MFVRILVIACVATFLGWSLLTRTSDATGPARLYVVQPGDTFAGIAQKEGFTVQRLEELNPNLDTQLLPEKGCINLVPDGCKILARGG